VLDRSSKVQLRDGSIVKLDNNAKNLILQALHEMSTSALRCLGFAYKDELTSFEDYNGKDDHPAHQLLLDPSNYSSIESELIFVGLVGLRVSFELAILYFVLFNFYYYVWCSNCVKLIVELCSGSS
jgi:Ca2+-transporting ATPase